MKKLALSLALVWVCAGLPGAAAYADTVNLTITSPAQGAIPGGTLVYRGTVFAPGTNAANEYLNGDSFSLNGPSSVNDSSFISNFPLFLTPGQTFTGTLFTVLISPTSPIATFTGTFAILGGPNASSAAILSSQSFNAVVTPEPASLLLLGTGLAGALARYRRVRRGSGRQGGVAS